MEVITVVGHGLKLSQSEVVMVAGCHRGCDGCSLIRSEVVMVRGCHGKWLSRSEVVTVRGHQSQRSLQLEVNQIICLYLEKCRMQNRKNAD